MSARIEGAPRPAGKASTETGPLPLEVLALAKRYGELTAVDGIDFTVGHGECVGLLGPNGAGKTTTVKMITCFSPITSGSARVFGLDATRRPRKVKELLGICPQEDNLDPDFSVLKNLLTYGRYFDIPGPEIRRRSEELLDLMQLTEKRKSNIRELSGGMKRRLMLARALLNRPRLLVLDEPTTGLDPQARHLIWQRVRQLRSNEGVTVLLTTHYMEEATQLCDRVILMDGGKILLEGPPQDLVLKEIGRDVIELWDLDDEVRAFIRGNRWAHEEVEERLYVYDRDGGAAAVEIERRFPSRPRLIRQATLEDVFLHRAGRTLKE